MLPETLSHYRILEKLGEGGMGHVYLAEDSALGRKVALKFLSPEVEEDAAAKKRFLREAKAAAAVEHPYVCQVFEIGEASGRSFIAMEYVAGRTLEETLAEGPLPVGRVLAIASEVAEALEEAHLAGLVHRDLKPANIMLTAGGHAKVMDFGLAKQLAAAGVESDEDTLTRLTEAGSTLGTMAYMSPEQLRGADVDNRSDIFSFGLVLYEMTAGRHPFARTSPVDTSSAILHEAPPPLGRYTEEAPELLGHIVKKMLAKEPDERYQSVHEVGTDLAELRQARLEAPPAASAAASRARARVWRLGAVFVVVLVAVGAVAWLMGRARPHGRAAETITSLAVLPFDNLMGDPEQQYFVDGIHGAVIAELSKIGALRVISRTSVNRYRDSEDPLEKIAADLRVDALVEGSVLRSETAVRITAQLIGVRPEQNLWAEDFEREPTDLLGLQSDVARAIARQIQVAVSPQEASQLAVHRPSSPEAHDAYLRGVFFADQRGEESVRKAQEAFAEAITLDPDYAPPYAALAELQSFLASREPPREALAKARAYAMAALELDDSLSEAHLTLADVSLALDWDWQEAERRARRTLELNPSSAAAHGLYAHILLGTGRTEKALEELQQAMALAPLAHRYT